MRTLASARLLCHTEKVLSITAIQKKRGRPATGVTPQVNVRLPSDLSDGLDKALTDLRAANRSEGLRAILYDWLVAHGYLELPPDQEDAN